MQFMLTKMKNAIQLKIRDLILKAKELRNESKRLFEVAKRAVEIAIEQDEAAGMAYLKVNT
jgi:type I restriction enzyme, S subunit